MDGYGLPSSGSAFCGAADAQCGCGAVSMWPGRTWPCAGEHPVLCNVSRANSLGQSDQGRGKRSLKYVLQVQRGQLFLPLSLLPSLLPLPPQPLAGSQGWGRGGT